MKRSGTKSDNDTMEADLLQTVMDSAKSNLLICLDREFNIIRVNAAFWERCRCHPEEVIGKPFFSVFPMTGYEKKFIHVRDTGEIFEFGDSPINLLNRPKRLTRYRHWSLKPVKDAAGRVTHLVLALFGEKETHQASNALLESEARLLEAQRMAHLGNWLWDIHTGDVQWSPEVFRIFDLDPETFSPQIDSILSLSPWPEDHKRDQELIRKAIESRAPGSYEQRFLRPDGSIGYYISTFQGIYDKDGKLTAMEGTVQDITERKQAEIDLNESRTFLGTLIRSIPDLVWLKDRQGRFLACNYQFERLYGAREKDIIGKTDYDFVDRELADFFRQRDQKAIQEGKPVKNEEEVVFAEDGQHQLLETIKTPIFNSEGKLIGVLGIARDISERKKAEAEREKLQEQLVQAQKLESVGRLAGGVAHDFNNMLGVILGHTEMAMNRVDPSQPLFKDLKEVHSSALRSAEITRQLLAFARKQTVAPRIVNLNEIVEGMLNMLRRLIGEDIDLSWLPSSEPLPVRIDPSQMDQMLANLCVNARDAIGHDTGKVTIETGRVRFDEAYCAVHNGFFPGSFVQLSVSDTGCGMSREILDNIFEPFFTTKALDKGTGLGLSTVYGIVKQNNGFINVYSEPNIGTSFKIYLPYHSGDMKRIERQPDAVKPSEGKETILLVEDEPTILNVTSNMLRYLGFTVLPASTPNEAVRLAEKHSGTIHLLVTDVIMPEMNGRDLARAVITRFPDLKILFISGYTANVIAHHGVLDAGVHFLQKPFSLAELSSGIQKALTSD